MPFPVSIVQKSGTPTLLHAEKANELINAINLLRVVDIQPPEAATWESSDGNLRLTFKTATLRVCMDGTPYDINVLVAGDPVSVE